MGFLSKLSTRKVCVPLVLGIFLLLVLLPPIMYGYNYPNTGDDTAYHLEYFDSIKNETPGTAMYIGRWMVGYPLVWLSNFSHISMDTLYLWFNFGVLCLIGLSVYYTVSLIFNWQSGLLTIPLVLFATPSTLNLFDNGAVFDLVTVGILFPLFLLCLVYAIKTRIPWLWYTMALFPLLVCFHSISLVSSVSINSVGVGVIKIAVSQPVNIAWSLVITASYLVFAVGCIALFVLMGKYGKIILDRSQKLLLILLVVTMAGLSVLLVSGFGGIAMRFATDLSIVIALFVGCLVGVVWQTAKSKVTLWMIAVLIILCSIPVAKTYLGYNSALTPTDMKAIEYVNGLEGDYYSCSSEIAPWIYGRFLNKAYKEGELPYIIRNKPMTYITTPNSPYYWGDKLPCEGNASKLFEDGDLMIRIKQYVHNGVSR